MKEILRVQMEQMKAEMAQEIERYYGSLSEGSNDLGCKISDFERMMVKHRKRTEELLLRATSAVLSSVEEAGGGKMSPMRKKTATYKNR